MKFSKSLLLGAGVVLAFSSVSASATITSEKLVKVIHTTRACPAAHSLENEPIVEQSWLSSFHLTATNSLRTLGDTVCNSLGNGLCFVGQWIKVRDVTQQTGQFNLNSLYFKN